MTQDLCIPKAFASILHTAGFVDHVQCIETKCFNKESCFDKKKPNMKAIHEYGQEILPTWLQCTAKFIQKKKCQEVEQYDLFVAIIKGSDNVANHAIGIYNGWIFDANEDVAIPLCQEGLNYCVSTEDERNEFVSFTSGFFFRQNSKKEQLKRKAEGDITINFSMTKKQKK